MYTMMSILPYRERWTLVDLNARVHGFVNTIAYIEWITSAGCSRCASCRGVRGWHPTLGIKTSLAAQGRLTYVQTRAQYFTTYL